MGCTPSENFSEHQVAYQCFDSEVCRSSTEVSESINLTSEVPFAQAGLLNRIVPTCPDGEDQGTIELYFTNTGIRGIKYNFSLGAFDDQAAIDTSTVNVSLKQNGSTTLESFDYEVNIINTNISGLENGCQINNANLIGSLSIASSDDDDPLYLSLGDTLFVSYNYVLCCTEGDGLKTATEYGVSSVRFNYGDICGGINDKSIFLNPAYTDAGGFVNRASEPLIDSPPQVLDGECTTFIYEFNELLISAPFGSQAYLEIDYQLPIGLVYQANSAQFLFGDVINNPMMATPSYEFFNPTNGQLILRYLYNDYTIQGDVKLTFEACLDCNVQNIVAGEQRISQELIYAPNPAVACNPICLDTFLRTETDILLNCPTICSTGGGLIRDIDANRINLGLLTNSGQDVPKVPLETIQATAARTDRLLVGDTVCFNAQLGIEAGSVAINWSNARYELLHPRGKYFDLVNASITIFDRNSSSTVVEQVTITDASSLVSKFDSCTIDNNLNTSIFYVDLSTNLVNNLANSNLTTYDEFDSINVQLCLRWSERDSEYFDEPGFNPTLLTSVDCISDFLLSNDNFISTYSCNEFDFLNRLLLVEHAVIHSISSPTEQGCQASVSTVAIRTEYANGRIPGSVFPNEWRKPWELDSVEIAKIPGLTLRPTAQISGSNQAITFDVETDSSYIFRIGQHYSHNGGNIDLRQSTFFQNAVFTFDPEPCILEGIDPNEYLSYIYASSPILSIDTTFTIDINAYTDERVGGAGEESLASIQAVNFLYEQTPPTKPAFTEELSFNLQATYPSNTGTLQDPDTLACTFIRFIDENNGVNIAALKNVSTGNTIPFDVNVNAYILGEQAYLETKDIDIVVKQSGNCDATDFKVAYGFLCASCPISSEAIDTCQSLDTLSFEITPAISELDLVIVEEPAGTQQICTDLDFEARYISLAAADIVDPKVIVTIPSGLTINDIQLEYPANTNSESINYTLLPNGNIEICLSEHSILNDSIPGVASTAIGTEREVDIIIKTSTTCDFISGSQVLFTALGQRPCRIPANNNNATVATSAIALDINPLYEVLNAQIQADQESYQECMANPNFMVDLTIANGVTNGISDLTQIVLPVGLKYDALNCTGINCPNAIMVTQDIIGRDVINLSYPQGIGNGATISFTVQTIQTPEVACAEDLIPRLQHLSDAPAPFCSTLGMNCPSDVGVLLASALDTIQVLKPNITLSASTTACSDCTIIEGSITVDDVDLGMMDSVTILLYNRDINGDILLPAQDSIVIYGLISAGTSVSFSRNLDFSSCSEYGIIAEVNGNCICTPNTAPIMIVDPPIVDAGLPISECSSRDSILLATLNASINGSYTNANLTSDGDGVFNDINGNATTNFDDAVSYVFGQNDIDNNGVTLTLSVEDVNSVCGIVEDSTTITIINVEGTSFPWNGQ